MQVVLAHGRSSWAFTQDKPYSVFALDGLDLRLVDDEGGTGLWPRRWFRVVDPCVAPAWCLHRIEGRGRIHLGPVEADVPGVFEEVFERAPGAEVPVKTSESLTHAEKARFAAWFERAPWAQAERAVSLGIYDDVQGAVDGLTLLKRQISRAGWPPGTVADPDRPGEVAVPLARGAKVIFGVSGGRLRVEGCVASDEGKKYERQRSTAQPLPLVAGEVAQPEPGPLTVRLKETSIVPSLTRGRPYRVLEIIGTRLRLISDNGAPALFPWTDLEPMARGLTPEWRVLFTKNGSTRVVPEAVASPGYFAWVRSRSPGSEVPLLEMPFLQSDERRRFLDWFAG
ncbi:MAG: hypothetical protein IPN01_10950 [Deltaproteobacteria bacterium]|nr:hypothetical protein [Deltaproteobacteria bacterium]